MPLAARESETARLRALRRCAILDTPPEPEFDDLAVLAARCCQAEVGLVSLVDAERVWFKAAYGVSEREVPRPTSPCAHAIGQADVFVVGDALADPRFAPCPLVAAGPGLRFYAGAPLLTRDGHGLGTVCALAAAPRDLTPPQAEALRALGRRAVGLLELRRASERWRSLLEVNNAIITRLDLEGMLGATWEALGRILPFERLALTLHQPERDVLRIYAFRAPASSPNFRVGTEIPRPGSPMGRVMESRRPLLRRDLAAEQESEIERRLASEGVRSLLMVPLLASGACIGTLNLGSYTAEQFDEGDAEFLQEAANQVALAVANARSYERIAALEARLRAENLYLQEEISGESNHAEIVGNSPALREALRKAERVAPTDASVLLYGETGVGKELFARAIHMGSPRRERPLVKVNCGAIPPGLVESELFGHVKGAFTGALQNRTGRFELADQGTIFLDEVGELPPDAQVKLLRVLQEGEFEPVGSSRTVRVAVRVIAASNRRLHELVRTGRFRADLLYRLEVFPLEVPPLRERKADIPLLVSLLAKRASVAVGKPIEGVSQGVMQRLVAYDWPGNVRELQNVLERAAILARGPVITEVSLSAGAPAEAEVGTLAGVERAHVLRVLAATGWVVEGARGAAAVLGLHPNTLRSRMKKLGIARPRHEPS